MFLFSIVHSTSVINISVPAIVFIKENVMINLNSRVAFLPAEFVECDGVYERLADGLQGEPVRVVAQREPLPVHRAQRHPELVQSLPVIQF